MQRKIVFDEGAKGFILLFIIGQLFFINGFYLFFGAICSILVLTNLQQPYKPSIFTVIFIYHFIQVAAGVWLSNFLGEDLNYRSDSTKAATIAGYAGIILMFAPIIYYQNKIPAVTRATLLRHANKMSIDKTFKAYVIAFFAMNALSAAAFLFSGLTQIIFSLANVKWFFFLLFGFQAILKNRKRKEFYFFCAFEFLTGFYSYFSEFKTVIFFIGFLYLSLLVSVTLRQLVVTTIIAISLFFGGAFYQSIKGEYRQFLNQGAKSQTVSVSQSDAFNKLIEISDRKGTDNFDDAIISLLDRFQYTYHLAKTMDRVPTVIPYQYGANWGTTIGFVLTPRILNPDKPKYEASVKASKYTGIQYSGARSGVSVSLGYFADGYIDYGYIGMFIVLLTLGFIYGGSYFYFVKKSSDNYIFNFAVVGAIYMEFFAFEMDSTFLLGRLFSDLLTFYMLKLFFFPWLMNYLRMPTPIPVIKEESTETAITT